MTTRRHLLIGTLGTLGSLGTAGCMTSIHYHAALIDGRIRVPPVELERLRVDDVMIVRVPGVAHEVAVRRANDGSLMALLARCTHRGCSVDVTPDGFDCPCHGARFDRHGAPLHGPATEPLRALEFTLHADAMLITLPIS